VAIMTAGAYGNKFGMLRSKVARRLFLLFVACALLPVGVLATFAFLDVRAYVNGLSDRRLREGSKSAGMTIAERMSFLETDLEFIAAGSATNAAAAPGHVERALGGRLGRRFRTLVVVPAGRGASLSAGSGQGQDVPGLTREARAHVRSGRTLITTARRGDGNDAVFVVRLLDPAAPDGDLIAGEVDPAYLWGADGFLSPSFELCVLDQAGGMLFTSLPGGVSARQVEAALARDGPTGRFEWSRGGDRYEAGYWTLFMQPTYLASWVLIQSEKQSDVQLPLREFGWTFSLVVLSTFWVVAIASLNQIRRRMVPVEQLLDATNRLKAGDFSHRVRIASDDEFAAVGTAFNDMTESIGGHLRVMNTINSIGLSLSAEKDESALLETVLRGAQTVFNADGAALHLVSKDGRLELALAHVTSRSWWQRGPGILRDGEPADGPPPDTPALPAVHAATGRTISTADVYAAGDDFAAVIAFDRQTGYRSRSFVGVPLRNHENEVIGILQLVNQVARTTGEIIPFSDEDRQLAESLASQAAVAVTKNRLVHDFKGLFEGLTDLISTATDEQSPHTGGHVRRVVVLSTMIAEALSRSAHDALREHALTAEELYELRIAALLHDCGKLTTPVHLTAKATKLEGIVDRICLIDARAEVVRRQHRLELLEEAVQRLAEGGGRDVLAGIEARAAAHDRQLEADLAVLRRCNEGSEFVPDSVLDRLRAITDRYRWTNARRERESLVSDDEMHHLRVRSGTLTAEERAIVQDHVVSTIRMLERLPYPKRLCNVPKYAGAHHEQVSGKGYPLKLSGDDIPIQGRIIGIADVLEALTATDRPYRRAMSLSEAMDVLGDMARAGAVDPDLYDLIISEQIHQQYADQYLRPDARP
jgi:HD-GYP domain-containing protein (c-di-GMP phosphodiesterase class II)/HAMP domain-containing protein